MLESRRLSRQPAAMIQSSRRLEYAAAGLGLVGQFAATYADDDSLLLAIDTRSRPALLRRAIAAP